MPARCTFVRFAVLLALAPLPASAQTSQQDKFHRAYFLEVERGDYAAAARLYDELLADSALDATLKSDAKARRAACKEELVCADLARLMPAGAIAYAELSRPGDQIARLLKQLGLLAADGKLASIAGRHVAISPDLIHGVLGVRGIAVAITGFNPETQLPSGVAILHAGRVDLLRGALETALPSAANAVEPIDGYATFDVEGHLIVTVTSRLIIAGTSRGEVSGVLERIDGDAESLATNPTFAEELKARGDALLIACVNFEPIMPLIKAGMAVGAAQDAELAVATTLLDPESLRGVRVRVGVGDDGISVEASVRLADGHHNLAYNLLRLPPVDLKTLKHVPGGAAGFVAFSLTDAAAQYRAAPPAPGETAAPITLLDFARELVANVTGVALFVMPGEPDLIVDNDPVPNIAAVLTVHDPAKSQALWAQTLGMASLASRAGTISGERSETDGAVVTTYALPEGIRISLATHENVLVLTPSKSALRASLATLRGGKAITDDAAFSSSLAGIGPHTSLALFAHAGRCLDTARGFMSARERAEVEPFRAALERTVASLALTQSPSRLSATINITGLPNVGPVLSSLLQGQLRQRSQPVQRYSVETQRPATVSGQ